MTPVARQCARSGRGRHTQWLVLATVLLLHGCGSAVPPVATKDAQPGVTGSEGGVTYEVWGSSVSRTEADKQQATIILGNGRLQIKHEEGKLLFRGEEYGSIKSGDSIVIDKDRRVFVNGALRRSANYSGVAEAFRFIDRYWHYYLYGFLAAALVAMLLLAAIGKVPVSYNLRNLLIRWKTTAMTALAFTAVVALMTVMMAFVQGMYSLTEKSGRPDNVVVLSSGAFDEGSSSLAPDDAGNVERMPGVVVDNGKPLASKEVFVVGTQEIPEIHEGQVVSVAVGETDALGTLVMTEKGTQQTHKLSSSVRITRGEKIVQPSDLKPGDSIQFKTPGARPRRRFVQIRGIENPVVAGAVHDLKLMPGGKWFSEAGIEEVASAEGEASEQNLIQTVVGRGLAAEIGRDRGGREPLKTGDTFDLASRQWKVVGILDSAGSTFDSEIWVKRQIAGEYFGKPTSYSSFVVRARDAEGASLMADELKVAKDTKFTAIPEVEYYSNMAATSRQFLIAIVVVALVMGIGGVFGVMNTMFAAISQRGKDIGVLRIMGYARRQILISFLLESLVLSLVGGLLGCALGSMADGLTARSIISGGGGGKTVVLQLIVNRDILGTGLLLSLFMGALGGFIPAVSAMRLRALESLR
ncbi:MAG: ABC transporter permease [Planctomycetales bacterium]